MSAASATFLWISHPRFATSLPDAEQIQYLFATVSVHEKLDIGIA